MTSNFIVTLCEMSQHKPVAVSAVDLFPVKKESLWLLLEN